MVFLWVCMLPATNDCNPAIAEARTAFENHGCPTSVSVKIPRHAPRFRPSFSPYAINEFFL